MGSFSSDYQILLDAPVVKDKRVVPLHQNGLTDFMQSVISDNDETKEPFYVLDLSVVSSLMNKMIRSLPMVQPFYAVKCNPDPVLLGALAALGSNFDCSSRAEIEAVLSLGVSVDRIIYANPCKAESHIKYAASVGVNLTTFDSKHELDKIKKWHPKCSLLLRIKPPDDGAALTPLGSKYGALPEEIIPLLEAAKAAGFKVIGVSFHIGSGVSNCGAYKGAIAMSKNVFETASQLGLPRMHLLNIGGGFTAGPLFDEATKTVKEAIHSYFSNEPGPRVISEPGRFFAETAMTLATNIIGKRVRGELREYWINDGVYGSMNCILNENATLMCTPLACHSNPSNPTCKSTRKYTSTVFGPSCDAVDTVIKGQELPELEVNDWLVFPNRGAYAMAIGSKFNGFDTSAIVTYVVYSR